MPRIRKLRTDCKLHGHVDEAIALYQAGWSLTQLADRYQVHCSNVMRVLKSFGMKTRSRREGINICHNQGRWLRLCREQNNSWNGGRSHHTEGYILIKTPDHPRADQRGYVPEHVLVAEKTLGRHLHTNEVVHHKNRKRADNRPANLQVMDVSKHLRLHAALQNGHIGINRYKDNS